ncbi:MAG: hypothetical protein HQ483_20030 [Rhodospirillales bacterium]|nr:hypothetical protein [Rhodospirillales bacterium]
MHINYDQAEDFEMLLAAEFCNDLRVPRVPGTDPFEAGYKILDVLACDLALDAGVLDFDELN